MTNVNFTLAWMLGNVEPYSDVVLAGFDTLTTATMDVITGVYEPTGKMPITLPKDDSVIAVNADGVCISPNDVPGYDKDQYMPASMKDENGKAYHIIPYQLSPLSMRPALICKLKPPALFVLMPSTRSIG